MPILVTCRVWTAAEPGFAQSVELDGATTKAGTGLAEVVRSDESETRSLFWEVKLTAALSLAPTRRTLHCEIKPNLDPDQIHPQLAA